MQTQGRVATVPSRCHRDHRDHRDLYERTYCMYGTAPYGTAPYGTVSCGTAPCGIVFVTHITRDEPRRGPRHCPLQLLSRIMCMCEKYPNFRAARCARLGPLSALRPEGSACQKPFGNACWSGSRGESNPSVASASARATRVVPHPIRISRRTGPPPSCGFRK